MSGKPPGPGERGRTTAPKATAATGVTTRSRSRGLNRPSPYTVHSLGTPSQGAPGGPAFHPGSPPAAKPPGIQPTRPQTVPLRRGAPCGLGIDPRSPSSRQASRGSPSGPAIRPTRPQTAHLPRGPSCGPSVHPRGPLAAPSSSSPGGGIKRGPPRGSGSPTKRGPASPPPQSRCASQSHTTHSRGQPNTPSKEITRGLARCSLGQQGISTRSGGLPVTPSRGGVTQGPPTHSGGQLGTPSRGVVQQRYFH